MSITLLFLFTFASGFLSFSQIALFSLSSPQLKLYKQGENKRQQLISSMLARPRDLLVTLLFCEVCVNIMIQNTAANYFGAFSGWGLKVGIPFGITLLFGDILPKTLALPYNSKIAYRVVPFIALLEKLLGPLRHFITTVTTYISRTLFFFLKQNPQTTKEEMRYLLESSKKSGILHQDEAEWIQGYLSLGNRTVKEHMRPREEILAYNISDPLSKLTYYFKEKGRTLIPVYKNDLQNMLGLLSAEDYFKERTTIEKGSDLTKLLKKPYYVPETLLARSLLHRFLQKHEAMGIVVDEYGSIKGVIRKEDLYEEIIGKIADHHEEQIHYSQAGKNAYIANGKLELTEFEKLFQAKLPTATNRVTIGGWLTEKLGDIPKSGTTYTWKGFLFQILAAEPNRIQRVYIRKVKDE